MAISKAGNLQLTPVRDLTAQPKLLLSWMTLFGAP